MSWSRITASDRLGPNLVFGRDGSKDAITFGDVQHRPTFGRPASGLARRPPPARPPAFRRSTAGHQRRRLARRSLPGRPGPGRASNEVDLAGATPRSSAPRTIARASGCSESASTAAASRRSSSSPSPRDGATATRAGSPRVSVPVLSKMTTSTSLARSSAKRSLTSRPFRAPSVVLMAMTSGIARPSAWGQAMTSTVAARMNASSGSPRAVHTTRVRTPATRAT